MVQSAEIRVESMRHLASARFIPNVMKAIVILEVALMTICVGPLCLVHSRVK